MPGMAIMGRARGVVADGGQVFPVSSLGVVLARVALCI